MQRDVIFRKLYSSLMRAKATIEAIHVAQEKAVKDKQTED